MDKRHNSIVIFIIIEYIFGNVACIVKWMAFAAFPNFKVAIFYFLVLVLIFYD